MTKVEKRLLMLLAKKSFQYEESIYNRNNETTVEEEIERYAKLVGLDCTELLEEYKLFKDE